MPIVLDGSLGVTTPMYNGTITANAVTPSVNMKNRIINGNFVIDQRNAGASVTPTSSTYTLDRFAVLIASPSKLSVQQNAGSVTPPAGFTNYLGITSLSAYSVASSDYFVIRQSIEGFNTADLNFGTANAKTITLSFWVRSSLTGTFGGSVFNSATNRTYVYSYTISSANTWEYKTVTIAGDTTGTWVGATNGIGLSLDFTLASGSDFTRSAGSWSTSGFAVTGTTSVVGTNGATFYITGVQLEVGSTATSFDYRPYGQEFDLCRRYYEQVVMNIGTSGNSTTSVNTSMSWYPKRGTPTLGQTGLMGVTLTGVGNYTQTASSVVGAFLPNGGTVTLGNFTGLTAQYSYYANTGLNTNQITVSAEL